MNNLLSSEEVKHFLEVQDGDLDRFIHKGKLHAYKIGGTYLRFRKEEVLSLRQELHPGKKGGIAIPWYVRLLDFWKLNNFYIISLVLIAALFYFVTRS